jgi:hypothetical protein
VTSLELAIKALAQQWAVEGRRAESERTKRDLDQRIFALEVLCVRLGYERLEVDLELLRGEVAGVSA